MEEILIQLATAFLGSFGFSLVFGLRFRWVLHASLGGLCCWGIYLLAKPLRKEISSYREAAAAGEIEPVPEKDRVNLLDHGFPTNQAKKKEDPHV